MLNSPLNAAAFALAIVSLSGCPDSSPNDERERDAGQRDPGQRDPAPDAGPLDAGPSTGGPCEPGPESIVCAGPSTLRFCTDDFDFDGEPDSDPQLVDIECADFFRNVGAASCETFDENSTEAVCTMDDNGPCGVVLATGQFTTARCTSDDAVCLLNLDIANYACTTGLDIQCEQTGPDFVPFCVGELLVWRCSADGDGIGQPHVDDCQLLGGGSCSAGDATCVDIQEGGVCNSTEWFCAEGLDCVDGECAPAP